MDVKLRFHHHEQHERARPYPIYVNVEFVNSRGENYDTAQKFA